MMRKTYTILAVALTASACGGAASEAAPDRQPTQEELARELASTPPGDALRNRDGFPNSGGGLDVRERKNITSRLKQD